MKLSRRSLTIWAALASTASTLLVSAANQQQYTSSNNADTSPAPRGDEDEQSPLLQEEDKPNNSNTDPEPPVEEISSDGTKKRYFVHFKKDVVASQSVGSTMNTMKQTHAVQNSDVVVNYYDSHGVLILELTDPVLEELKNDDMVDFIEDDVIVYKTQYDKRYANPSDRNLQSELSNMYGIQMVQAPQMWAQGFRGQGVKVCVIDSGIDVNHPDFTDLEGTDLGALLWQTDVDGHGTHVAGTVGARGNDFGVVGVAPEATIHVVDVFGAQSGASLADILSAMDACIAAGARVINMSLGSCSPWPQLGEQKLQEIRDADNVVVVVSAGNTATNPFPDTNCISYPAFYDSVISVAAVDSNENKGVFSTFNSGVDIAGPGVAILSSLPSSPPCAICDTLFGYSYFSPYGSIQGTSMAAPHVAGVAALLLNANPAATAGEIISAMLDSAKSKSFPLERNDEFGHGIVQAFDALQDVLAPTMAPSVTPVPTITLVPTATQAKYRVGYQARFQYLLDPSCSGFKPVLSVYCKEQITLLGTSDPTIECSPIEDGSEYVAGFSGYRCFNTCETFAECSQVWQTVSRSSVAGEPPLGDIFFQCDSFTSPEGAEGRFVFQDSGDGSCDFGFRNFHVGQLGVYCNDCNEYIFGDYYFECAENNFRDNLGGIYSCYHGNNCQGNRCTFSFNDVIILPDMHLFLPSLFQILDGSSDLPSFPPPSVAPRPAGEYSVQFEAKWMMEFDTFFCDEGATPTVDITCMDGAEIAFVGVIFPTSTNCNVTSESTMTCQDTSSVFVNAFSGVYFECKASGAVPAAMVLSRSATVSCSTFSITNSITNLVQLGVLCNGFFENQDYWSECGISNGFELSGRDFDYTCTSYLSIGPGNPAPQTIRDIEMYMDHRWQSSAPTSCFSFTSSPQLTSSPSQSPNVAPVVTLNPTEAPFTPSPSNQPSVLTSESPSVATSDPTKAPITPSPTNQPTSSPSTASPTEGLRTALPSLSPSAFPSIFPSVLHSSSPSVAPLPGAPPTTSAPVAPPRVGCSDDDEATWTLGGPQLSCAIVQVNPVLCQFDPFASIACTFTCGNCPPTSAPTESPSLEPTSSPTIEPSSFPTDVPTHSPSTAAPSQAPSAVPTALASSSPSQAPSTIPTKVPSSPPDDSSCEDDPDAEWSLGGPTLTCADVQANPILCNLDPFASFACLLTCGQCPTVTTTAPSMLPSESPSVSPSSTPSANPTTGSSGTSCIDDLDATWSLGAQPVTCLDVQANPVLCQFDPNATLNCKVTCDACPATVSPSSSPTSGDGCVDNDLPSWAFGGGPTKTCALIRNGAFGDAAGVCATDAAARFFCVDTCGACGLSITAAAAGDPISLEVIEAALANIEQSNSDLP